jgi:chromosome segregation ATPase
LYSFSQEFIGLRGKVIKLDQILTRKRGLLETVQRNKVEGEASLVRPDRQVSDAKLTVSKQKMRAKALSDEGMNLRTMINQASLAMKQNKDKTEALRQAMSSIFEHVVRINEAVEKLRERYRETQDGATSAEERLIQMNNMIEEEETKMFDLRKEADRLKKCLFQSVDTQTRIKLKLGQFDYEIKTAEMGFKKLKAFCKSQDYEVRRKVKTCIPSLSND